MRIKFFSSFCDSSECKLKYERLCEVHKISHYGKFIDKHTTTSLSITTGEDYTHAIILNIAMPNLKIPKQNVIGLAFEPPAYLKLSVEFIQYAQKHIGKYFIGDNRFWLDQRKILPEVFIEGYAYMWHITPLNYIPLKNKLMSIMISDKQFAPGHKYRHALVNEILRTDLPIDIYGRGVGLYRYKDSRLKGKYKDLEPYENYSFHICIENFQLNHYFSEKITNTLLCGATPVYLGCKNIHHYFPANVITMSGNISRDLILLRDIIQNPRKYTANINVDNIKDKLNLLKNVENIFAK